MNKILIIFIMLSTICITNYYFCTKLVQKDWYIFTNTIKRHKLKNTHGKKKIVFVGGSSNSFGLDGNMIQNKYDISYHNMGVHAHLGLRYMIDEVEPYVDSGDIVIIAPEYEQFFAGISEGGQPLAVLFFSDPTIIKHFSSFSQVATILKWTPMLFQSYCKNYLFHFNFDKCNKLEMIQSNFNNLGDHCYHWYQESEYKQIDLNARYDTTSFDQSIFEYVKKYTLKLSSKKIRILFLFPAIPDVVYLKNSEAITYLHRHISQIKNMAILGKPEDMSMPLDKFFNTMYHLNYTGIKIKMNYIINYLQSMNLIQVKQDDHNKQ